MIELEALNGHWQEVGSLLFTKQRGVEIRTTEKQSVPRQILIIARKPACQSRALVSLATGHPQKKRAPYVTNI